MGWVRSLGWEDILEKGMATHSRILAWRIPWTEEPGRLQSMGSQRVGHDWVTNTFSLWKKERQPRFYLLWLDASQYEWGWSAGLSHTVWSCRKVQLWQNPSFMELLALGIFWKKLMLPSLEAWRNTMQQNISLALRNLAAIYLYPHLFLILKNILLFLF